MANGTNLGLLDIHNIQRLFRGRPIMNILVCCLLTTEVGIVVTQRVEHFAEGLVQSRTRLINTRCLRVVLRMVLSHVLLHLVLVHHVRVLLSLHIVRHLSCNLPLLNLCLIFLGI